MKNFILEYFPWMISATTIWMTILMGNKHKKTWIIGIFNQVLWTTWILISNTWGLLPLNITLWFLYVKNHLKWNKEQ